jgi:hypothetical protein
LIACERHLAVVSFANKISVSEPLAAIARLERANSLAIAEAVLIVRDDDDSLHVTALSRGTGNDDGLAALTWLIREMLETPEHSDGMKEQERYLARSGMSESFMAELHDVLSTAAVCVALVVSGLDATAAVQQFGEFPASRLVYGALPVHALASIKPA